MKKILKHLNSIDLFAEPVSLTLFSQKKFYTFIGSFFTFALFALLFIICYPKLNSIVYREDVQLQNYEEIKTKAPAVNLMNRFAISLDANWMGKNDQKRYVDFYAIIGSYNFFSNNTSLKKTKQFALVKCEFNHFPMFTEEQLINLGMRSWLCPDYNNMNLSEFDFSVQGTFGDYFYNYIQVRVNKCDNKTTNVAQGIYPCALSQEISKMKKKTKFYMNLIIVNNLMDLNNFNEPLNPIIDYSVSLLDPGSTYIQKELYFVNTEIETDITQSFNIFRNSDNIQNLKSFLFEGKIDEYIGADPVITEDVYASFYLRSSKKSKRYLRKYDCFQDYLQVYGAFFSIFSLLFKILNNYFSNQLKIIKIAKSLYDFDEDDCYKRFDSNSTSCRNFFSKIKNFLKFFYRGIDIQKNKLPALEKQIDKDFDIISLVLNLKRLNNLKKAITTPNQCLLLNLTGTENFNKLHFENSIVSRFSKITALEPKHKKRIQNKDRIHFRKIREAFLESKREDRDGFSTRLQQMIESNKRVMGCVNNNYCALKHPMKKILNFKNAKLGNFTK